MIHILWLILKIIGGILLGVLGLFIGLLLVVLFSAVRYRIEGKKQENFEGQLTVTWLLRAISIRAVFQDGLDIRAKVLGKTVWKLSPSPGEEKEEGEEEKKEEEAKEKEEKKENEREPLGWKESEKQSWPEEKTASEKKKKVRAEKEEEPVEEVLPKGESPSVFDRIWAFFRKLQFSISSICGKLKQGEEKIEQLQEKWEGIKELLDDPANQKSAGLVFRQIKKILHYLLPRKGKAWLRFGMEDPAQMGQVLSAAAFCYPFFHNILTIYPVFDQKILEGEGKVQGHIRMGVLLGYVLRLLFDRNIWKHIMNLLRPSRKKKARI